MTARLVRWVPWLAVLPLPFVFVLRAATAPAPAWSTDYRSQEAMPLKRNEREQVVNLTWTDAWDTGPLRKRSAAVTKVSFSVRLRACLQLEADSTLPFMLVSAGRSQLAIDGQQRLSVNTERERTTRGATLTLSAGKHVLDVEYEALETNRPVLSLLASFDGGPPQPIASGKVHAGVRVLPAKLGSEPCP